MRQWVPAIFLVATVAASGAALTTDEQRQSDRYLSILRETPTHPTALQRLWQIHLPDDGGSTLFEQLGKKSPESLADALVLGYLLLESGNPAAALNAFETATTDFPDDPTPYVGRAAALRALERDPVPSLQAALELDPEYPDLSGQIAAAHLTSGKLAAALSVWEQSLAARPDDPGLRRQVSEALLDSSDPLAATPHLQWLADHGDPRERIEALRTLSELNEKSGDLPAAIEFATRASNRLGPAHWSRPVLEARITQLHARAGTLDQHLASLRAETDANPLDWRAWHAIATIETSRGHPDRAIAALRMAADAAPGEATLRRELATAEADFGDLERAISVTDSLLDANPGDHDLQFFRAALDIRSNRLDAARERVDTLLTAEPATLTRATEFLETHRLPAAARELWQIAASQGDPGAILKLAAAHLATHDLEAALVSLRFIDLASEPSFRAASLLRDHGYLNEAIPFLEAATDGDPTNLEAVQRLAATLVAVGRRTDAERTLENAIPLHPDHAATLDRQLYDILAAQDDPAATETTATPNSIEKKIAALSADADSTRLKRWQRWRDGTPAQSEPEQLIPDSDTLDALAAAAEDAPESVTALTALAAARQAAGDYYAALDAWDAAFKRAPISEQAALLPPILAVTRRLQLPERGLQFLIAFANSRPNESDRITAWIDAVEHAKAGSRLDLLEAALSRRPADYPAHVATAAIQTARGQADDAFATLEAHARLAADPKDARLRTLEAATQTGDQPAVIRSAMAVVQDSDGYPAWRRAAETLETAGASKVARDTWLALERRFNRNPDALAAAADYHDRTGDKDARAEALFAAANLAPTDANHLANAMRIAQRRSDRDLAITFAYQLLDVTKPAAPDPHLYPGDDEISPDVTAAAHTVAMRAIGGVSDPSSLATIRAVRNQSPPDPLSALRLEAIRTIAQLATGGTARERWLAWCADATPYEAAWGTFAAGEFAPAHEQLLTALAHADDPAPVERALIWNALRRHSFTTLREWINSNPALRRRRTELLFLNLSRLLAARTADLTATDLAALFPDQLGEPSFTTGVERWRAAWLLAAHADFRNAVRLASQAGPYPTDQQAAVTQLASWHLLLGERQAALDTLSSAESVGSLPLDDPLLAGLRLQWLFSTEAQRSELRAPSPFDRPTRDALLAALAHPNDTAALTPYAEHLVDTWRTHSANGLAAPAFATLVRNGVHQLFTWNLPALALAICESAQDTEPLVETQTRGALEWRADLAILTANARLRLAAPRELPFIIGEMDARQFNFQAYASLARSLDASGYTAAATSVRDELLRRHPDEPAAINERLISATVSRDLSRQADLLECSLRSGHLNSNFEAIVGQTERLTNLRLALRDPSAAIPFVTRILQLAPADPRIVTLWDRTLTALDRTAERREFWENQTTVDPLNGTIGLARLHLEAGEPRPAIATLRAHLATDPPNPSEARRLLYEIESRHGDKISALARLHHLAATDRWEAATPLAISLVENSEAPPTSPAIEVLRRGLRSAPTPRDRFECGRALIDLEVAAEPDLERMSAAAEADVELIAPLYEAGADFAAQSPKRAAWFEREMRAEWRSGAGTTLAGDQLISAAIASGDTASLDTLLSQYLNPAHYLQADWNILAAKFAERFPAQAARVYHALAERQPDQPGYVFREARQLWRAGDRSAAIARASPWIDSRALDPSIQQQSADFFRDIGRPRRAAELYAELIQSDAAIRYPDAWLNLAALHLADGHIDTARLHLLAAVQNPSVRAAPQIAAFLIARGDITTLDPESNEFSLPPDQWTQVRTLVAESLVSLGHYERALAWADARALPDPALAEVLTQIATRGDLIDEVSRFWEGALAERPPSAQLARQREAFLQALRPLEPSEPESPSPSESNSPSSEPNALESNPPPSA